MTQDNAHVAPNNPKTPLRSMRIPDSIWKPAGEVAAEQGETISEVVRDGLVDYMKRHGRSPMPELDSPPQS